MNIYVPKKGSNIYQAAVDAAAEAGLFRDRKIFLRFNELDILVHERSVPDDIAEKYSLQAEIRRLKG